MITRALLAPIAIQDKKNKVVSVDLGAFATRLLLFDRYVLQSVWLEEIPFLVRACGAANLIRLLESGVLRIYCESYTIAEIGRARADLNLKGNNKRLPLGSFSFAPILATDPQQNMLKGLDGLHLIDSITAAERTKLFEATLKNVSERSPDFSSKVFGGFYSDLRGNPALLQKAVVLSLTSHGVKPRNLSFSIIEVEEEDFRAESNLTSQYGLSEQMAHDVLAKSLMAVGGLNQRILEMETHSAVSGFKEGIDLSLLEKKISLLAQVVSAAEQERRLDRVVGIAGLPTPRINGPVDFDRLLDVRESDEARAFRDWLSGTDVKTDEDLRSRLVGLKSRIRELLNSAPGKSVRFLVSAGLSVVPGVNTAIALLENAVDAFLIEKIAPKDSVVSFLNEHYTSIFRE